MEDYLSKLNPQQRAAVEYLGGPELVIAGAGSGKTRVLTYKIVHLLANGYEPWRILALTFTNKAAKEMRERIETLTGAKTASRLWMGTFHSIFSRILHQNAELVGYRSNFTIYDSSDSKSLIKLIIKDMNLDDKVYKPNVVQSLISTAKNALISPEAYTHDRDLMQSDRSSGRDRIYEIYGVYMTRCRIAGAMDFDDLLYYTYLLLRNNPEVLEHYREFFRYVLVDEYQDTNFAQHQIIKLLCHDQGNLCVVGDDAQSIYSFRGANIRNILEMGRNFPGLEVFKLEQNYRSTQNIINAANSLIAKNRNQIQKSVYSRNDVGRRVVVVSCLSDYVEAGALAAEIMRQKSRSGDDYSEFAVLYRTNAQSRVLEESLRRRNIPYRIYGGLAFYQRKEVKDAVSYFRLVENPNDDEALRRVINVPARGIGAMTLLKLATAAIEHRKSIFEVLSESSKYNVELNKGTCSKLESFRKLIEDLRKFEAEGNDAYECAHKIISATCLLNSLKTEITPENISRQENLEELLKAARQFVDDRLETDGEEADVSLGAFLSQVSLATDQDMEEEDDSDSPNAKPHGKLTLMTIHAAKGLEFNNIFIVGVENEIIPGDLSSCSPEGIEEERRLLYVAITRAKNFCMMSYARERFKNGSKMMCRPSQFIYDIDAKWLDWKERLDREEGGYSATLSDNFRNSFFDPSGSNSRQDTRERGSYGHGATRSSMHPLNRAEQPTDTDRALKALNRRPAQVPQDPAQKPKSSPSQLSESDFCIRSISDFSLDCAVVHQRFGNGVVTAIDGLNDKITVKFDNFDTKTLLLKYAKLAVLH